MADTATQATDPAAGAPQRTNPVRLAIVGSGWRAGFFARMAARLTDELELVGVTSRRWESAARAAHEWGTAAYDSVAGLVTQARPDLVVVSVPWDATPGIVTDLVERDVRVLAETPPAPTLPALRELWAAVGATGSVQVAEQYLRYPGHAARLAIVREGTIGIPTSVQVSSTHGYHAVSLMRGLLQQNGFEPVCVSARRFTAPLVDPLARDAWTDDPTPKPAATVLATIDFGDAHGLYDFTDNQWHNQLRHRRILVRGSRGEIQDDDVTHLVDERTILSSPVVRRQLGHDLNLDGHDTEHLSFEGRVVWRNPFVGERLMDEEIAIATLLRDTAAWVRGAGPEPYPLAQACQDHAISLAIDDAVTSGDDVTLARQPWASSAS